jgi:hypothetical protein
MTRAPALPHPLKILWRSLINAYDALFIIILSNLLSILLMLPALLIPLPIIAVPLSILCAALAFSGLFYTNYQVASGESVDWRTYFEGIRRYWWPGIRWTVLNGVVLFSTSFYLIFFSYREEAWAAGLMGLDLGLMAMWVLSQMLTFPLMLHQEQPRFRTALRNALVFLMRWPTISFVFLLPALLLILLTLIFPPIGVFLSLGLIAYLCCYVVYFRIEFENHPELFLDPKQNR